MQKLQCLQFLHAGTKIKLGRKFCGLAKNKALAILPGLAQELQ